MHASGQEMEAQARQDAKERAQGTRRVGLSPAEIKRRLALKKAKQKAERP